MEKITLKCNKNILNLLKQYNIYTKTYIENPRRFSRLKTKDFITIPLKNNQLESAAGLGIEEYCAFKFSNILHEMGSFSFNLIMQKLEGIVQLLMGFLCLTFNTL
ncbi:TPA: hypothetical protein ACTOCQ_000156 [Campylobacter jejuni]